VAAGEDPGGTGGSHTKSLSVSNLPPHTHGFTTDSAGAHSHGTRLEGRDDYAHNGTGAYDSTGGRGRETTTDGAHTHTGTTNSTGSGMPFDIRPKYCKLAFIMKL
jgi:microcystin-dependent protein